MPVLRVAGTDPGTTSLDVVILEDGAVREQHRFLPHELQADPALPVRWLEERGPFALVAGPSGYGLPLVPVRDCGVRELALMTLLRPDERDDGRRGVVGFSALLRALVASSLPVVFLPGVIHLPSVPAWRKLNRIDLGTPDKLCVAALVLFQRTRQLGCPLSDYHGCLLELGSAFTACVVLAGGRIVDGLGGTSGALGHQGAGAWDGELAYLLSPLAKRDLFTGGLQSVPDAALGSAAFVESVLRAMASLRAVTLFAEVVLSGRLLETAPELVAELERALSSHVPVVRLESLPGAWVKHAAQGAALVADGLADGGAAPLVEHLALRQAAGTVLDHLCHPRVAAVREQFQPAERVV
jgi:predicted butyrate kinase (DUF1464 family)